MKKKILIWFFVFLSISLLGFVSIFCFYPKNQLGEFGILLVRKHVVPELHLSFVLDLIFKIYSFFGGLLTQLDKVIPFFPSLIKTQWWTERVAYIFVCLPIIFVLTSLITLSPKRKVILLGLVLTFLWVVPVTKIVGDSWDKLIVKSDLNYKYPWSKPLVWIWSSGESKNNSYTSFKYQWKQKSTPTNARVLVSCLGNYQLIVNKESIYHGPSFAVPPRVNYDLVDIGRMVQKGNNEIVVICNYTNEDRHEHATYPAPGLLIGGEIKDGMVVRNLADNRFWLVATSVGWENGEKISADAGYSEVIDYTRENNLSWKTSEKLNFKDYLPQVRQTPLLVEKPQTAIKMKSGVVDLGKTMVGYLTAKGKLKDSCTLTASWGDVLTPMGKVQNTSQNDKIVFSKGEVNWEQFSRRSGRYVEISRVGCESELTLGLKRVEMPFVEPEIPAFKEGVDKEIYELAINTLKNNVQDHFEDSVVREKAMYVGDAREISRCLMVDGKNNELVREMIRKFAQAQNLDGSIPAMAPSGEKMIIYDYVFQWVTWLDNYINKTNDVAFAKEMWPVVEKIIVWAQKNEDSVGLLKNNWWVFIDWTPIDRGGEYTTGLQIWYYQALRSAGQIAKGINVPGEKYTQKANQLENNLIKYAFDDTSNLFADSFSLSGQSKGRGLVTNSLAGIANVFPSGKSSKAVSSFGNNLYSSDPFSESWIVEWLISVGKKDLAQEVMRNYWGGMIKDGATAIYEDYTLGIHGGLTSYSHAWGCGPIYLYKQINP